ncbi:hypothetical protein E2C01_027289 [Portunus trituberculatus]|uniref:Uncharacterized protein n=1 Tax=Portunus trituberculatus TaxID=210409 RepID=A0A5B7EHH9_PORTR|nr:hypothetical protein [Portunus trituberculatus]
MHERMSRRATHRGHRVRATKRPLRHHKAAPRRTPSWPPPFSSSVHLAPDSTPPILALREEDRSPHCGTQADCLPGNDGDLRSPLQQPPWQQQQHQQPIQHTGSEAARV